jgi:hypothetical protein
MATSKPRIHAVESPRNTDVIVHNEGTIFLFELLTTNARKWVAEHVQPEPWQMYGHSLAVEHRYARDLADAIHADGLVIR